MNKKIVGIFLVVLAFMSCSSPKALEYREYHNFSVEKLGYSNSTIKMDLVYFNPNNFRMQLRNTD
ncbi:MAG: hypothetical protein ACTHM7_14575, partial [Ginsengibacter sp.]